MKQNKFTEIKYKRKLIMENYLDTNIAKHKIIIQMDDEALFFHYNTHAQPIYTNTLRKAWRRRDDDVGASAKRLGARLCPITSPPTAPFPSQNDARRGIII